MCTTSTPSASGNLSPATPLAHALHQRGIGTAVYYPIPLHRAPAYLTPLGLPHTDIACTQVLCLPVHPDLTPTHLERIAATIAGLTRNREPVP